VLSSASAGIIRRRCFRQRPAFSIRSAEKLIGHGGNRRRLGSSRCSDVLPELDDIDEKPRGRVRQRLVQGQITISRDGHERNLSGPRPAPEQNQPVPRDKLHHHALTTLPNWFPRAADLGVGATLPAASRHEDQEFR